MLKITSRSVFAVAISAVMLIGTGCTRIETGEVGLRVGFDRQISTTELLPGSFNQTMVGDVMTFPVRDIQLSIENKQYQTADNSTLKDFDVVAIYNITPTAVSDLYINNAREFHSIGKSGGVYLMYNYMESVLNNAAQKAVRKYKALEAADNRDAIEKKIREEMEDLLKERSLDGKINITQVQVRSVLPADSLVASSNEVIRSQNELKAKMVEVQTAEQEAKRIAMLNSNAKAIDYMNAQANMKIAEAVEKGKVNTIILPYDFRGMINVK